LRRRRLGGIHLIQQKAYLAERADKEALATNGVVLGDLEVDRSV